MMERINAPGWLRNVYPVTYLSGDTQDCADLHSFGPSMRENYVLHYILRGRGVFEENGRAFPVETGGTFLVRPRVVTRYAPDPADPWEYIWVDFCGNEADALFRQTGFASRGPVAPPLPGRRWSRCTAGSSPPGTAIRSTIGPGRPAISTCC